MTRINNIGRNTPSIIKKPVNAVKNICVYTYNIAPRTVNAVKTGRANGEKIAKEKGYGSVGTFLNKHLESFRELGRNMEPLELPVVLSALAIPLTPVGGSPLAFLAGCVLVTPIFIKKLIKKELTGQDIKEFLHNMTQKNFIKLEHISKTDGLKKALHNPS